MLSNGTGFLNLGGLAKFVRSILCKGRLGVFCHFSVILAHKTSRKLREKPRKMSWIGDIWSPNVFFNDIFDGLSNKKNFSIFR